MIEGGAARTVHDEEHHVLGSLHLYSQARLLGKLPWARLSMVTHPNFVSNFR
jgi:hypothetical protein